MFITGVSEWITSPVATVGSLLYLKPFSLSSNKFSLMKYYSVSYLGYRTASVGSFSVPLSLEPLWFSLTGAEKAWKQLTGAGRCLWKILTNSTKNRTLLQSFPLVSFNFDVYQFLVWLTRSASLIDKCLHIRDTDTGLWSIKTVAVVFLCASLSSPVVLASSALTYVP